jgi:hypothetical protein
MLEDIAAELDEEADKIEAEEGTANGTSAN